MGFKSCQEIVFHKINFFPACLCGREVFRKGNSRQSMKMRHFAKKLIAGYISQVYV